MHIVSPEPAPSRRAPPTSGRDLCLTSCRARAPAGAACPRWYLAHTRWWGHRHRGAALRLRYAAAPAWPGCAPQADAVDRAAPIWPSPARPSWRGARTPPDRDDAVRWTHRCPASRAAKGHGAPDRAVNLGRMAGDRGRMCRAWCHARPACRTTWARAPAPAGRHLAARPAPARGQSVFSLSDRLDYLVSGFNLTWWAPIRARTMGLAALAQRLREGGRRAAPPRAAACRGAGRAEAARG